MRNQSNTAHVMWRYSVSFITFPTFTALNTIQLTCVSLGSENVTASPGVVIRASTCWATSSRQALNKLITREKNRASTLIWYTVSSSEIDTILITCIMFVNITFILLFSAHVSRCIRLFHDEQFKALSHFLITVEIYY